MNITVYTFIWLPFLQVVYFLQASKTMSLDEITTPLSAGRRQAEYIYIDIHKYSQCWTYDTLIKYSTVKSLRRIYAVI